MEEAGKGLNLINFFFAYNFFLVYSYPNHTRGSRKKQEKNETFFVGVDFITFFL
jgi:hypothetical protein